MGYEVGKSILYQKTGLAKSLLALDLLSKNTGDRIQPISELENHHDRLKVVSLAESDYNNSFSTAILGYGACMTVADADENAIRDAMESGKKAFEIFVLPDLKT